MSPMADLGFDQPILIVDDDPDIRESLGDMLQHEGYLVHLAGTGGEAIREAKLAHYGAEILDMDCPISTGMPFSVRLVKQVRGYRSLFSPAMGLNTIPLVL